MILCYRCKRPFHTARGVTVISENRTQFSLATLQRCGTCGIEVITDIQYMGKVSEFFDINQQESMHDKLDKQLSGHYVEVNVAVAPAMRPLNNDDKDEIQTYLNIPG